MLSPEVESQTKKAAKEETEGEAKRRKVTDVNSQDFESGYSEEQQSLDIEARSGDLYALKKSKKFQNLNSSAKALVAYQTISGQLGKLVDTYARLVEKDLHQAQKMLAEIKKIRAMQKMLLTKLFGELKFDDSSDIDAKELEKELKEFLE